MKKKSFFIKIAAAVLLTGLLAGCGKVKNLAEDTLTKFKPIDAFNIRQVITQDSATSRTVMWQSKTEEKDAFIEYRAANQNKTLTQKERINDKFSDNGRTSRVHTVTLQNLQPGTEYEYRLAHGDSRSRWYQLNTAKGNKYKALIFPDSQSADYKAWENVAMPAWKRNQDAQFFMMIGDLVDNGEHDYQWNEWFSRIQPMITRIPVATVLGNHETYTMDWQVRMPLAYLHYFQLPGGVPQKYQNQFYSFDYGDVHFVVLNNLMWEMDRFQPDMLAEQKAWFRRDMEQTKKKWKVVLMHRDIILYEFNRPGSHPERFDDEGVAFMPLFDRYGVDVVLTGHLHTYRNRGHIYNYRRDSRGPLYILTGVAGDVQSKNLWKHSPYDIVAAPEPETSNYMVMEAEDTQLKFSCYLPDGTKIDEAVVKK